MLAPHPDDETLGAGALIAHAATAGRLGGVAFLTDGSGSHPAGTPRVSMTRRGEAHRAIRRLGGGDVPVEWLGWHDAHPHKADSRAFARDAAWLAALLRRRQIDAIAVADRTEAHCDHVAAYRLADAAIRLARRPVSLFAYHVWSALPASGRRLAIPAMPPGIRRHALRAHRSQMSPMLGAGFRLPPEKLRMSANDILTIRSGRT
ncbi:PIG-L family deacetylase [Sphingomonas nostoxanthinifaciens]|nr:PIG-L family deacetylase [Sphingomonas nostoxanthinifaciens]